MSKKLCGLWGANIEKSKLNNDGRCACIDCVGHDCANCGNFHMLVKQAQTIQDRRQSRCFLCQEFVAKNR